MCHSTEIVQVNLSIDTKVIYVYECYQEVFESYSMLIKMPIMRFCRFCNCVKIKGQLEKNDNWNVMY